MKRSTLHIIFMLLSLLALFVVTHDYACGHTIEDVLNLEYCPICQSFHATEKAVVQFFALLPAGYFVRIGIIPPSFFSAPSPLYQTLFALRAPPAAG